MTTEVIKTIKDSGGDYTSLAAFVAGEARDLTTADEIAVAEVYNDQTLSSYLDITGFTCDSTRRVVFRIPTISGEYDTNYYHYGIAGAGVTLNFNTGSYGSVTRANNYVTFQGFDVNGTGTSNIFCYQTTNLTYRWQDCLLHDFGNSFDKGSAIEYTKNCEFFNLDPAGQYVQYGGKMINCACHVVDGFGLYHDIVIRTTECHNVALWHDHTKVTYDSFYQCTGANNATNQPVAPGASSLKNLSIADFDFVSSTDLHIGSSSVLRGAGVGNAENSDVPLYDIDLQAGNRAGSTCDIGADEYVSGGGSVFSASLSLSQSLGVSSSGQASAVSAVSMGKALAVSDGGQGDAQSSVSLDEVLQIINSGSAVSSGQIQVGNISQVSQSGAATAQGQTALSDIKSIQVSGLSATSADVSLAQILSFVSTYGSANNVSLALSKSLDITTSAAAQIVAIAQLNYTDALAVTGSAQAASALSLACSAGLIVSSNAPQVAVLALAMQAGVGVSATVDYPASVEFASHLAISSDANAQSKGSLTLSQRVALVNFGQSLAASGLTISNIKSIQFIGSTVTVSLVLPNGRTFVVEFEARTFTVKPS